MGRKSELYSALYHNFIPRNLPQKNSMVIVPDDVWGPATAVWRNAWRDAGVYLDYDNRYHCHGEYININHLYLPERLLVTEYELGKNQYQWGNVLHLKEAYNGDGTYTITRKQDKGTLADSELVELLIEKDYVERDLAKKFVQHYRRRLIALRVQSNTTEQLLIGWNPLKGRLSYYLAQPLQSYEPERPHAGVLKLRQHTDIESIFFIAAVFSLLKPQMKRVMKSDAENFHFALYVCADQVVEPAIYEDFLERMDYYANLYCNYRSWGDALIKKYNGAKFWYQYPEECNLSSSLSWWNHLGFPVVFSDYRNMEEDEDAFDSYDDSAYMLDRSITDAPQYPCRDTKVNLSKSRRYLNRLSCLPVFLLREGALGEEVKGKEVLSLSWKTDNTPNSVPYAEVKHKQIMEGYIGFLDAISKAGYEAFRKVCHEASSAAYKELGTTKKDATQEQRYRASLLCCLHIADRYAMKNTMFWVSVQDSYAFLKAHIAHQASAQDFAHFIARCIAEENNALFHQSDAGIYLHYKKYWPAFQEYCRKRGIVLSVSAAHFRKTELKNYIKPQYNASGSKYPRYDYRKKVDGREAVVLNVSPQILKLIES